MIDELIKEGEALAEKAQPGALGGKVISGIEFETWAARVVLFFERELPKSALTEKVVETNKRLNKNSYSNYEFLLGALKAAKDFV